MDIDSNWVFTLWLCFRYLFIFLLFVFLISGLDDLFIDVIYITRKIFRALFRRKKVRPVTREQLDEVPEQKTVIMVPAWDEARVIRQMLLNTINTMQYQDYVIFVGTYPNDEDTRLEVEKVREVFPRIEVVVTPGDGPTNKADCLNWIYQGIRAYEQEHKTRFAIFVMQDAEDVIHPLSLKFYNYLIPKVHFIQIPVFPMVTKWYNFVTGVYMDEFAESHTKELRVREVIASSLPSAGVGTAYSRRVMSYLARNFKNQIFDVNTLTEDYLMCSRLRDFPGRKIFLQQEVEGVLGRKGQEPVATRELFPERFRDAVRQKSRWILGIGIQGWKTGLGKTPGEIYYLYRDRKSLFTNIMVVVGYVVVFFWAGILVLNRFTESEFIPPLIQTSEVYYKIVLVVLAIFAWRILNRIAASWSVFGPAHGLLALPRLIFGNFLNFCATVVALLRYLYSLKTGMAPAWGKTDHAFPTLDQLRSYRHKLGDMLLERRVVTAEELQKALATQKRTGEKLGKILLDMGALWEEDLIMSLSRQLGRKALEIDPYATDPEILEMVPRSLAVNFRVFPVAFEKGRLVLACDSENLDRQEQLVEAQLGRPVTLQMAASKDISFAIERGYKRPLGKPVDLEARIGPQLMRAKIIDQETLTDALRRQKRSRKKLGDILIEMGAITPADLENAMGEQ